MLTLRDIGIRIFGRVPSLQPAARWIYLRLPQRLHDTPTTWLKAYFRHQIDVAFIQIGAFDGVAGDPIRPLVLACTGWHGALVEPQPEAFARLQDNYSAAKSRLQLFNCAVSDVVGDLNFYEIEEGDIAKLDLPPWSREVASLDEDHIKRHFPGVKISKRIVRTLSVSDIARLAGLLRVDLIVIDTEGAERQIIDDLDVLGLAVRVLLFEHKHMLKVDMDALGQRLTSLGFTIRNYGRDTIAFRRRDG